MRAIVARPPSGLLPLVTALASVVVARFLLGRPQDAAMVAYVVAFVAIVWSRPYLALMLIFAGAPFQNDLSGAGPVKFSIAEINLVLTFGLFLTQNTIRKRGLPVSPIALPVFLYFTVCLYSSVLNWRGSTALISMIQMLLYFVVAVMVFSALPQRCEDLHWPLYGLVGVGVFLALVGFASGSNYYLGLHKNGAGASLACALIVATELWFAATVPRKRALLATAMAITTAGLIFSLSRGAWLGAAAGILLIVALRKPFKLLLWFGVLLTPLIFVCWTVLPPEAREYATDFRRENWSVRARYDNIAIARGHYEKNPLFGDGVGLRKEFDANNVLWLTLAETGIAGLAALLLLHLSFLRLVWSAQRLLRRTDPLFSLLALGGALVFSKLVHGCVDHYWSRGHLMIAWAGAGMAIGAYYTARGRLRTAGPAP